MKFFIDYGTGEPQCCESNELGDVVTLADKGATLTHEPILVTNEKGKVLARRNWYENLEGIGSQEAPIKIGDGYYGDWRMALFVAFDMD